LSDRGYGLTTDVPTVTSDTTWGAGSVTQSFVGSFPNTPNVKRNWKLLKCKKFTLDGGQSHTLNYYIRMNKRVDKDLLIRLKQIRQDLLLVYLLLRWWFGAVRW
jgi:hypothetical protein